MRELRDMELLVALSQRRHFARAAEACGISQPAFSARIRNLERDLGVPIVKRGNRFEGFTAEGEIVLKWALRMLADAEGLDQEIAAARGTLSGRLVVGVIPTALTFAAEAADRLRARHPGLSAAVFSLASSAIRRGLEDFSLDAGITYLDTEPPAAARIATLYAERYVLLCPPALAPRASGTIGWAEAATLPLCLLTRDMRNRRIVDDAFADAGTAPVPAVETNAFTVALAQVAGGRVATIAPEALAAALPRDLDAVHLPLVDPVVEKPVGLVTIERDPASPGVDALTEIVCAAP